VYALREEINTIRNRTDNGVILYSNWIRTEHSTRPAPQNRLRCSITILLTSDKPSVPRREIRNLVYDETVIRLEGPKSKAKATGRASAYIIIQRLQSNHKTQKQNCLRFEYGLTSRRRSQDFTSADGGSLCRCDQDTDLLRFHVNLTLLSVGYICQKKKNVFMGRRAVYSKKYRRKQ